MKNKNILVVVSLILVFITIYIIIYKKILSQIAIVIFAITSVYYKDIYLEHILSHEKTDVVIQILDIAHT